MTTATVSAIRTSARQLADMENSNFVSPTEWISYINKGYKELYDMLVAKFEDWYTVVSSPITVAEGSTTLTLPTGFYKLRGVDKDIGGGNFQPIGMFNFNDRGRRASYRTLRGRSSQTGYRLVGSTIYLNPPEFAPGTYQVWYTPVASTLTSENDTVEGVNGWEHYIELFAALQALAKEESDVSVVAAQLNAMKERINEMAMNRDMGLTERVSDVRSLGYDESIIYR